MKLEITEEDHRFIESIVQQFDPSKILGRPDDLSQEDWTRYLEPFRLELADQIRGAMLARALHEAGVIPTLDPQSVGDLASACGLDRSHATWSEEYEALANRVLQAGGIKGIERWSDLNDEAIAHSLKVGAGA